jgi:quinol monooxygenase YgiN
MIKNSSKVVALRVFADNIKAAPRVARRMREAEPQWQRVKLALMVRLEARPGKENELAEFLRQTLSLMQDEPETTAWFAIHLGKSSFAIFDVFTDEAGLQAHLSGALAAALKKKSLELLAKPPVFEKIDVLAAKLAQFE